MIYLHIQIESKGSTVYKDNGIVCIEYSSPFDMYKIHLMYVCSNVANCVQG
jgi:hypothetical protein